MGIAQKRTRMSLSVFEDKYQIQWVDSRSNAYQAAEWCDETFGPEWGQFAWRNISRDGVTTNYFTFYRMDHAQWFMLKWRDA